MQHSEYVHLPSFLLRFVTFRLSRNKPHPGPEKLFALIIGINAYPRATPLRGSVLDAEHMQALLRGLGVPDEQVTVLLNEQATRNAILDQFEHLINNTCIKYGDNTIFIFFSGHGASIDKDRAIQTSPPGYWDGWHESRVEMLCPYDIKMKSASGRQITGIPDKMVACFLNKLAAEKGNNIVHIFAVSRFVTYETSSDSHVGLLLFSQRLAFPG